jgi:hypothetical protein
VKPKIERSTRPGSTDAPATGKKGAIGRWWSTVGQLIERELVRLPADEKLVARLTSRRKLYDSRGREKLESKADLATRGVESPDRADALIGATMLGPGADPHVLNPRAHQALLEIMQEIAIRNEEDPWRVDWIQF